MGNAFAIIGLLMKYGPSALAILRLLAPVAKQAAPIFKSMLAQGFSKDVAAQLAIATAAPHIETPRVDPVSGKKLLPGALTVEEEMGTSSRMSQ